MSKLKNIIYLTQSDYTTLSNGGTVTKNGHTLTGIDEDSIYITTDQASVEDLTGILPVAHGGTGKNTLLSGQVLIGNGTSAITSKAIASTITNDSNTLPSTAAVYNSALLKSGGTMTGVLTVLGNQYADGYNGALNMNNSDIYGLNSIYTTDSADNAGEGIHFYRDSTHVDTLWINGGDILFVPNRTLGTATTKANSEKVARLPASITASRAVYTDGTTGELAISSVTATELGYLDGVTSSIQTQLNNKAAANAKITIAGNDISLGGSLSDSTLRESLGLSKALRFIGVTTTDMTGGTTANHSWTGTPAGISNYTPKQGDVVINSTKQDEWVCTAVSGTTYTWERLGSDTSYKIVQSAVNDPTAATTTSTTFIDTISQNTNGVITATKKTLPTATDKIAGITKVGASGGAAAYSHTHSYLANTNKGAENRPIYITGNAATECEYMFPIYYKALDFSSTAPVPGAYPVNNETNPATNTTGWYGSALSLPGINASTKYYAAQVFIGSQSGVDKPVHIYVRRLTSSPAWSGWSTVLDDENYNSYAPTLTGNGASGTWNIDISGSAGSVAWTNVSSRPTNVSSFTNDAGYLTSYTETDPTVPAWAKAASKPSYTASEVGALASSTVVTNVAISANVTTKANYPIVFATSNKDTTAAKDEGLQKSGAKFYFNPSTGNVQATTFNGYTLAAASAKGVVTTIDTSANLPTSNAVKSFVEGKGYTTNTGTVTSVKLIQGAGITVSSSGTAITTTGERTISITGMDTTNGSTTKWLNQKGGWSTPTAANVGALASSTVVTNVAISANTVANDDYPIVFAISNTDTTAAKNEGLQKSGTKFFAHPSTGMLYATKFCVDESVTLQYNDTDKSLDFIF